MIKLCGHNGVKKWTGADITELQQDIQLFKLNAVARFSSYKNQDWEPQKGQWLDHIGEHIVRNGGLCLCDAVL